MAMPIGELDRLLLAQRLKVVEDREVSASLPFTVAESGESVQQAVDDLPAGGGTVIARGDHNLTEPVVFSDVGKIIHLVAYGARFLPAPGVEAFVIDNAATRTVLEGVHVDPLFADRFSGQTGFVIKDSDYAVLRDCSVLFCGTAAELRATDDRGWSEYAVLDRCVFRYNQTAIHYHSTRATAPASFGECALRDVGLGVFLDGAVGVKVSSDNGGSATASLYRNVWDNVVMWFGDTDPCTGVSIEHSRLIGARLMTAFESPVGNHVGWAIGAGNFFLDVADITMLTTGAGIPTLVSNPNNTDFRYHLNGGRDTYVWNTSQPLWRGFVHGDTQPRVRLDPLISGGGALSVGPGGTTAPDTQWYRSIANQWRTTDNVDIAGTLNLSGGVVVTANYTMPSTAPIALADASGGAFTVTLPTITNVLTGPLAFVHKIDAGANPVTVQRAGTNTIEGATSVQLANEYDYIVLRGHWNGSVGKWYRVGGTV